jgi:uncharacterized protein (DUF1810 family)
VDFAAELRDGLDRFVRAQEGTYETALAELTAGRKRSHWMWYVFPQLAGLGSSEASRYFAIASLDEARAYLAHPRITVPPAARSILRRGRG